MVSRRDFTITLVLTPIAAWLSACGGGDDGAGDGVTSNTSPTIGCDGLGAKSSLDQGHAHDVCVPEGDLSAPPSQGATYTTTNENGHTHQVTLDAALLSAVGRGEVVRVTTTTADGHVHTFALARAGTISPPPQPGSGSGSGSGSGGTGSGGY